MTPEQKRTKIAEACGWQSRTRNELHLGSPHTWTQWCNSEYPWGVTEPSDYLNDLNAMHEAEKHLGLKYDQWTRELRAICERDRRCIESATAAQRAEAFLRAIGKWEDGE